jgi:hypothetical protein
MRVGLSAALLLTSRDPYLSLLEIETFDMDCAIFDISFSSQN